jgi:hypothetical protein
VEVVERRAVRQLAGQRFETLEMEHRAVPLIRPRLRDHVDDATRRASELGRRAAGNHLKLLHRVERDIDRHALPADLLTEEAVVEVATVQADVVEDAALPGERDLVTVRALHHTDAGRERQQVLELATEDRRRLHGCLVERRRKRGARRLDDGRAAHGDGFRHVADGEARREVDRLSDREIDVLLNVGPEPR